MGFEDIEDTSDDYRDLREHHSFRFQKIPLVQRELAERYHEIAHEFRFTNEFINLDPAHKNIWRLHCMGVSVRKIASRLKGYKRSMVHYVIKRLKRVSYG